ncbi:ABC transporter permease [Streptomyces sp. NPDC055105]|uniref:ABC transporter permease n=1 Tax=Streptomyces sp. NPDC055105 TaxID=3365719 RepID=UPI0037D7923C
MTTTTAPPSQRRRWRPAPARPSPDSTSAERPGRAWRTGYFLITNGVPVLAILGWWIASRYQPEYIVPSPVDVLARTWDLFAGDSAYYSNTYASFVRVGASVLIALVIGTALAVAARYIPLIRGLLVDRLLPFINAFPSIGWAIAGMYWLGVSTSSVIFVEVAIILPFTAITVWEALKALDAETMEMAQSFTRSNRRVLVKVVGPSLGPHLFTALRLSYGAAWKVAIVAEIFGASTGLGYLLNNAREQFDSSTLYATILTLIIIVYAVDKLLLQPLENVLMRYRTSGVSAR